MACTVVALVPLLVAQSPVNTMFAQCFIVLLVSCGLGAVTHHMGVRTFMWVYELLGVVYELLAPNDGALGWCTNFWRQMSLHQVGVRVRRGGVRNFGGTTERYEFLFWSLRGRRLSLTFLLRWALFSPLQSTFRRRMRTK